MRLALIPKPLTLEERVTMLETYGVTTAKPSFIDSITTEDIVYGIGGFILFLLILRSLNSGR